MENKEECKTCKAYNYEGKDIIRCAIPSQKDGESCPCLSCLVKSMCGDNNCQPFKDYVSFIWGDL